MCKTTKRIFQSIKNSCDIFGVFICTFFFIFLCYIGTNIKQWIHYRTAPPLLRCWTAGIHLYHPHPAVTQLSPCYIAGNHNLSVCSSHLVQTVCCSAQHCPHSVWRCMTCRSGCVMNIEFRQRAASFSSGCLLGVEHNWASAYKCVRAHTHARCRQSVLGMHGCSL